MPPDADEVRHADVESGLIYLGAVGMIDPPREEARQAIADARTAGIRTIMITGDHPDTGRRVAELLGLMEGDGQAITGRELDEISDEDLASTIDRIAVFARAEPDHKIRLVRALRERGHIVAMTGDGVNDAPALKLADIGIAMGITGTDVAKEASDMVLLDDNYATIVSAIEEGRSIYSNIRKVVTYLLSTNTGEILVYLYTIVAGMPIPLIPVQILWINLVTDGFATLPISLEPREEGILNEPPRNPREPIVTRRMAARIFFMSALMFAGVLGVYNWGLATTTLDRARTLAFAMMALFQMFNVYNVRSERLSLFRIGINSNPYIVAGMIVSILAEVMVIHLPFFQRIFDTVPLSLADWGLVVLVSISIFIAEEVRKALAPNVFSSLKRESHR
jgi:Ca2+-transporting ATPase